MDELTRIVHARGLDHSFVSFPTRTENSSKYSLAVPRRPLDFAQTCRRGHDRAEQVLWHRRRRPTDHRHHLRRWRNRPACSRAQCGLIVEPGQAEAFAQAILTLSADPQSVTCNGRARACHVGFKRFTRRQAYRAVGATSSIASDSPLQCSNGENPFRRNMSAQRSAIRSSCPEAFGKR